MGNEVYSAAIAIGLGALVGVALFVPFVAVSYRRRGGLTFGRFALWAAALVYFWAIWTYTLLPLPDSDSFACAGVNLNPAAFIEDLRGARSLTDFAVLQLALNVLLFVPLGFFLRVLGGRGVVTALLVGFGVSLTVETTQLTGVWGVYPCAYRVFDVDDLLTNTLGAVLGSVVALLVPRRLRGSAVSDAADRPRPVTRGRRVLAIVCDALAAFLVSVVASVGVQLWLQYVVRDRAAVLDGTAAAVASDIAPILVWLVLVLATGRSVGDVAVQLRYRGGPIPVPVARLLRYLGGLGGFLLLGVLPGAWSGLQILFGLVSVVLLFTTGAGRGLPGILSGQALTDARADEGAGVSRRAAQRSE
ncbi:MULTISPECIES: VanZ family protein [unclassified Microbacterium]|uniref:VanZ family protein n=1 Tax=unclassified Microbacterium TaxID=2609290 RepID=UPI00301B30BB